MSDELNKPVNPKKARILVVIISLILTAAVVACGIFIVPDLVKKAENEEAPKNTKTSYVLESMVLTEYHYFEDFNHEEKIDCKLIDDGNAYHLEMWPRSNDVYRKEYEFVFRYDNEENITGYERYNEGEKLLSGIYDYDEYGNCISFSYSSNGTENIYHYINEYDDNKNCIKITEQHNGEDYRYTTFEYDEKSNLIKETVYSKGELYESFVYEYNDNDKLEKITKYNKNGEEKAKTVYEYDNNENLITITLYSNSSSPSVMYELSYTSKTLTTEEAENVKSLEEKILNFLLFSD